MLMLDFNGDLFYRKFMNEVNLYGKKWEKIDVTPVDNLLNRIVDFDVGNKHIMTIMPMARFYCCMILIDQGYTTFRFSHNLYLQLFQY